MKILWAKTDFLHPTDRGGQIRTLEMLRRLHLRHEVHYVAYDNPETPEGRERAREYSTNEFPVKRTIPPRNSPAFFAQLAANMLSPMPLAVGRYRSRAMRRQISELIGKNRYDAIVADFLSITPNFSDLSRCVLFQHNVEWRIWARHAQNAQNVIRKAYFGSQARRMETYERRTCRTVHRVISVSPVDSRTMREQFGVERVEEVPTGVDIDYFHHPREISTTTDIVFVGAMDWLPNIDGLCWFVSEILPLIRKSCPGCSLTVAGRNPTQEIRRLAESDPLITVTGTVPDVRPFVWRAAISIVPLRIGGGTRLKIFEAMASGIPVVSTAIGAEGLAVTDGKDIVLADSPAAFAHAVVQLLGNAGRRATISEAALELVTRRFSWEAVTACFETILESSLKQ